MISETGGRGCTIQNEQVFRERSSSETAPREQEQDVGQESSVSDTVVLSVEDIAQA